MIIIQNETVKKTRFQKRWKHEAPGDCPTWGERCGKCGKKNHFGKVCKQKATTQLHQQGSHLGMNQHTLSKRKKVNVEIKKK